MEIPIRGGSGGTQGCARRWSEASEPFNPGAGGTAFWVDPKEKMVVVYMMQAPSKRLPYRVMLRNMVYAAVVD